MGSVLVLTGLNYLGIAIGGGVQTILTLLKVGAIVILSVLAFTSGQGSWEHFIGEIAPVSSSGAGLGGFFAALAAALWAYDGWNNLTLVGGEVRNPQRIIPKVLILGITAVMAVYLLTNLAYFYVLPLDAVQRSARVAQDVAAVAFGDAGATVITLAALVSTLAALNGAILSGGRVYYAMARDGLFFRHMADLNPVHRTPAKALLLQSVLACSLILIFGRDKLAFEHLFNYAIFGLWGFYGITALAVIVLRRRHPHLDRPYRTFGYPWVPLTFLAVAGAFCLNMLIDKPQETMLGLMFLLAGLPFYAFWRRTAVC
jgi:amino acid transporter